MKVKEIIEELQRFNPDDRVCFVNEDGKDEDDNSFFQELAVSEIEPYNGARTGVRIILHEH